MLKMRCGRTASTPSVLSSKILATGKSSERAPQAYRALEFNGSKSRTAATQSSDIYALKSTGEGTGETPVSCDQLNSDNLGQLAKLLGRVQSSRGQHADEANCGVDSDDSRASELLPSQSKVVLGTIGGLR